MIRSGLCSVTFRALEAEEIVDLAAQTGIEAIEWGADRHVAPGDFDRAREVNALCRSHGIAPASYGSYIRAGTPDACRQFAVAVDTAGELGAGNIRVWAGEANLRDAGAAAFDAAAADLRHMAGLAATANVTVSVEYHRNTLTEEAEDARSLLDTAQHDNLFSYWQPVPGRGRARWLGELRVLEPHLGDLHVFHWIMTEAGQERRPLGEGIDDWRALIDQWTPAPRWPHPRTGYLEFVRGDEISQFKDDVHHLLQALRGHAAA